jgi:chorismate dehydratase
MSEGEGEPERVDRLPPIRIGGIDYLNALPLTRYLEAGGDPPLEVFNHVPSILADSLRSGALDVALVPVVEYLARPEYRVVPGICIASYGEVRSIRLFYRRPIAELRRIGLDECSRTSVLLTKLLCRGLWRVAPEFRAVSPAQACRALEEAGGRREENGAGFDGAAACDALLLIGDAALCARPSPAWEAVDLGTVWTSWTGLPFVYAFWVWRGQGRPVEGLERRLHEAKAKGRARIDDIVRERSSILGIEPADCLHYLSRVIQYDLEPLQVQGLLEFFRRLETLEASRAPPHALRAGKERLQWLDEPVSPPA